MSPSQSRKSAFTLVELLVVIGIIALLISILLPALNRARKSADTLKCESNLRQVGMGFSMYAQSNKGWWPVTKADLIPSVNIRPAGGNTTANVTNLYWIDFVSPYIMKNVYPVQTFLNGGNGTIWGKYRDTVLWGCSTWQGSTSGTASWNNGGVSVYDPGYVFNMWPTMQSNYPPLGQNMFSNTTLQAQGAMDSWNKPGSSNSQGWPGKGQYYQATKWTHPAERCLVTEGNLWLLAFVNTNTPSAYDANAIAGEDTWTSRGYDSSTPGSTNIDRYRHGQYSQVVNSKYVVKGGRQSYNILYCDGHVVTSQNIADSFRAIQMR